MKRRWFIRCCFMLPIMLCVGGWGWSALYWSGIDYNNNGCGFDFYLTNGTVQMSFARSGQNSFRNGWSVEAIPQDACFWPSDNTLYHYFLGFSFNHNVDRPNKADWIYDLCVPFWFLILVLSAVLFFVWRKTRLPVKGRAFPVEVSNPS